jgi:phage terminase large subunit GpA-like protein
MEPLRRKFLNSVKGQILVKRFIDGRIQLCGGQSVNNLQSFPYRIVMYDEIDSLAENLGGDGDPIRLGEVRTDSFGGQTLLIAYAHPTIKEKGAGKLFYEDSDQRRGHVRHCCGREFWLDFFDDQVIKCRPRLEGQTQEQAKKDPDCYQMHCPGCAAKISEAERVAMLRGGIVQKSVLPPEVAAKKRWIGVHASQLYTPAKTMRSFYVRYIEAMASENEMRVFVNKVLGDVYEPKVKGVDIEAMRKLIVVRRRVNDPEFYIRRQVPPGVLFLTGGQDSRTTQLHHAVWGWGVREAVDKTRHLCGWLIDWAELPREHSLTFSEAEYHVYDDLIYRRRFKSSVSDRLYSVRACGHDIGYEPTQIPIIKYTRNFTDRAKPCRGASLTPSNAIHADYVREGKARKYHAGDEEVVDEVATIFNTYLIKTQWYGMVNKRIKVHDVSLESGEIVGEIDVPLLNFPADVENLFLEQSKNEKLVNGEKKNELVWVKDGPNHLADCNTYAYGLALWFDAFSGNLTADEYEQARGPRRPMRPRPQAGPRDDPSYG